MKLKSSAFDVVKNFMSLLNPTFTDHGIRVAYIYLMMSGFDGKMNVEVLHKLIFLCIFHDVGAFKTEETEDLLKFEVTNTLSHSVYGYLYIKHLSPLSDYAPVLLYHHLHYDQRDKCRSKLKKYAMRLNLADRTDICAVNESSNHSVIRHIVERSGTTFDPFDVKLLLDANKKRNIIGSLRDGAYEGIVRDYYNNFVYEEDMLKGLIMMLALTIDFKHEETVTHSIQVARFARSLGSCCGISDAQELDNLYYAGLLHNIGELKLPDKAADERGLPTAEEKEIKQKLPQYTREILSCIFDGDDVADIASGYHKTPDGYCFPDGQSCEYLSLPQKIMAVANMASILLEGNSVRTEAMPKEDVRILLGRMAERGRLDKNVVHALFENYDKIRQAAPSDALRVLERYEAMKKEYLTSIRKYSALNNTFFKNNKLFDDFCAISKSKPVKTKQKHVTLDTIKKSDSAWSVIKEALYS